MQLSSAIWLRQVGKLKDQISKLEEERDMWKQRAMNKEELDPKMKAEIDAMDREDMARARRFAPLGDPMFQGVTGQYFEKRFKELGQFSPQISKKIGWDDNG